ncbi:M28 family peptidase [Solirubrobacter phytolaccae]|uniref:M28 family peptidase n=1 Tax=Solirubrobacter phytolaccae TaxID=1404360 RepID=A0A9X3NLY3_9ACTN|nr:M28 family peptidase [Solirubrobacter phytolaccae]MDA0183942.1 M28 family peptidase [Solirubrobacter phytolaccae]
MLSHALRAATCGVALVCALAPTAAHAAKPKPAAKLSVSRVGKPPASAETGSTFKLTARVANAKGRKAAAGRLTLSLRPAKGSKTNLKGYAVKSLKSGKARSLSLSITVPATLKAGTYSLVACVRRTGSPSSTCKTAGRIKISVKPAPVPPAPPAPQPPAPTPAPVSADTAKRVITAAGLRRHLDALQEIATFNGGNRASGLAGYGATQAYVVSTLRAAGYTPQVQPFDFLFFRTLATPVMEQTLPTPRSFVEYTDFAQFDYSGSGDVTAAVRAIDINTTPPRASTSGCEAGDFAALQPGEIALVQRGTCDFAVKIANAEDAGAAGAIVFNQGDSADPERTDLFAGTLGVAVGIPSVSVSYAEGVALQGATVHLDTSTRTEERSTSNIIAETPGGDPGKVVLVGSHLDSVPEGPGINDNGTGSAFNLELAVQLAKLGAPANKVRFAWWGAEEEGLIGSTEYVNQLSDAAFANIAMNLNFDMLGSPNHAKLVYDGDFSDSTPPASAPDVNPGSAEIEKAFVDYFAAQGLATEPTAFDGRSDYQAFQDNGTPAGGLFSGAEELKSAAQATKWGGLPNVAFDVNYHGAGDTIDNIDWTAFEQLSQGAAYVTGRYAARTLANAGGGAARAVTAKQRSARAVVKSDWRGSKVQR